MPLVAPSGCACGGSAPSGSLLGGSSFTPTGEGSGGHCGCTGAKENGASPTPSVGAVPPRTTRDAPTPGSMFVPGSRVPRVGTPPVQFNVPRGPRVPMSDSNGWRGNVPVPPMTTKSIPGNAPRLAPPIALPPKNPAPSSMERETPSQAPALPPVVMALPGLSMAPNPFAQYCGNGIDPASELCRAAASTGLSDYCRDQLLAYLAAPEPKSSLESWIAQQELCSQDAFRAALGMAKASMDAKASAGLYRASGALPNYHRAPYGFRPSGDVATAADWTHGGPADLGSGGYIATASDWGTNPNALVDPGHGSGAYNGASSWTLGGPATDIVPPAPATPPVDYAALVAGIGTGLGATLGGISSIVRNANDARLRELELQYGADARAGQLALQRATMETNAEIQRLARQGTPAANEAMQALQMQFADMSARLQAAQADEGMSDTTKVFLGLGAAAVLAGGFWLATRKDRR